MKVLSEIKGHFNTDVINVKDPYYGDIKVTYENQNHNFLRSRFAQNCP